ncbi:hypothetical protein ISF6_5367 [Piscinibacter sakaiensis]|uniref:Uncharacterized protein n=2 Tax=Piscinibacter sakaiensis TaxID=1547922 RepID=A0A0K8NWL1_PISS1|nr:hypothetical protein ISF6_5367 [Piscinibacter sakaiensis]
MGEAQVPRRRALAMLIAGVVGATVARTAFAQASTSEAPARWTVPPGRWTLDFPQDMQRLDFRGEIDADGGASDGGAMLYPAPSFAGFLVGVLAHAAFVEGSKSARRDQAQAEAQRALQPLAPTLEALSPGALAEATRPLLPLGEAPDWRVEAAPVFVFSRDLRSLSVESHLLLRRAGAPEVVARTAVRATAPPQPAELVAGGWNGDEGAVLRRTAARLLAQAVGTGVRSLGGEWQPGGPQRTVRYPYGGGERIDRVQVLEVRCEDAIVRHLRGDLMVIPWRDPARAGTCAAAPGS